MTSKARFKFYRSLVRAWGRRRVRGSLVPADRPQVLRAGYELWRMEVGSAGHCDSFAMRVVPDSSATRYKLMAQILRSPSQITGL